jgi:hypothetical protein
MLVVLVLGIFLFFCIGEVSWGSLELATSMNEQTCKYVLAYSGLSRPRVTPTPSR